MAKLIEVIDRAAEALAKPPAGDGGLLLITSGGLGDTVLLSLVLDRFTALAEPDERVTVLMRRDAAKMAFLFPADVEVMAVDYGRLLKDRRYRFRVMKSLGEQGWRLAVTTDFLRHPLIDEALLKAADAKRTLGMKARAWAKYDKKLKRAEKLYDGLYDSGAPVRDKVLRWVDFANWLSGRKQRPPKVHLPDRRLAAPVTFDRPTVMIQPFSAVSLKQVPPATWKAIMDALPSADFVLLGAPGDLDAQPAYRCLIDAGATLDTSTFEDLVPKLRGADLVISVDTALMHLSVAVGAPTLCLASAAYVGEIVPYSPKTTPDNATFLYHPMPCEGCLGACVHPPERGMYPCVACLDEARIVSVAKTMLKGRGNG